MAPFEWLVLAIGGACIVGFCWLFGLENENVHLMMTSAVTIIMTTTLVLLFELQCPFQSDLRIPPDDWNGVVSHIEFMQHGSQEKCACKRIAQLIATRVKRPRLLEPIIPLPIRASVRDRTGIRPNLKLCSGLSISTEAVVDFD